MDIFELFELLGVGEKTYNHQHIDNLINNSTLTSEIKSEMEDLNNETTETEIMDIMLRILYDNQPDNIVLGNNYNQTDILRKLRQIAPKQ